MKTICLCNQKGGVGKTTTCFHLADAARRAGLRVLVVDMDPQGNITRALSHDELSEDAPSMPQVLSYRTPHTMPAVIVAGEWPGVDVAPTVGDSLAVVRDELLLRGQRSEQRLADALKDVDRSAYDLALIDCPPAIDLLTQNSMTASDAALIITHSRYFSITGLSRLLNTLSVVKKYYNPALAIAGIVVNQHEDVTTQGRYFADELRDLAAAERIPIYEPLVPKRVVIADAAEGGHSLTEAKTREDRQLAEIYDSFVRLLMEGPTS